MLIVWYSLSATDLTWLPPLMQYSSRVHVLMTTMLQWHTSWLLILLIWHITWTHCEYKMTDFLTDIFKCIFLNENVWISINISLTFVLTSQINNIPALVQIMAWHRPGNKPLSEPMMFSLLMHVCITWTQWVKHGLKYNSNIKFEWYI